MPDGIPSEAYAVPIKPTLPPRPTVSGLLPERKRVTAAPTAPKIEPFPQDFITGETITQELNEKYNALQTFMGEMWGTYGINPQKPNPGSQSEMLANQRYTQLLSDLRITAQRAKNERQAQISRTKSILSGSVEGEKRMEGMTFQQQAETAMVYAPHVGKVTRFNQSVPLKIFDRESLGIFNERRKDTIKTLEEGKEDFKSQTYTDAEGNERLAHDPKEVDTFFDGLISTVRTPVLDVEARITKAQAAKGEEISLDIQKIHGRHLESTKQDFYKEKIDLEPVFKKMPPKKADRFRGQNVTTEGLYIKRGITTEFKSKIAGRTVNAPVKYYALSKDGAEYLFVFEGDRSKIISVEDAEREFITHSGEVTTGKTKAREDIIKLQQVEEEEKVEIPTASMENWIARGWSEEQVIRADKLGKIKIIR